jgi:hypothetical protein
MSINMLSDLKHQSNSFRKKEDALKVYRHLAIKNGAPQEFLRVDRLPLSDVGLSFSDQYTVISQQQEFSGLC